MRSLVQIPGALPGIFRVEAIAIDPSYQTVCEAIALSARAALALYREWMALRDVECIQIAIPVQHARWSQVAPLQFGYNDFNLVAHWRVIKGFYSPLYRQRYPFAKDW